MATKGFRHRHDRVRHPVWRESSQRPLKTFRDARSGAPRDHADPKLFECVSIRYRVPQHRDKHVAAEVSVCRQVPRAWPPLTQLSRVEASPSGTSRFELRA